MKSSTEWFRGGLLRNLITIAISMWAVDLAQAEHNTDYIFNGTTTNFSGALYIPMTSPGTNNSLQILNGGAVTNAGGAIGLNSADDFNRAVVSGVNSLWQNNGNLSIGSNGSHNHLFVTNSGRVNITGDAYIGSTGSRSNRVTVADAGSRLDIGGVFYAGYAGADSQIVISNGGTVKANYTYFGLFLGSTGTVVTVTGTGSTLTNNTVLYMGAGGNTGNNRLTIENGGRVFNTEARVGEDTTSGNNIATVTGANSLWTNTTSFYVGRAASTNTLIISNGGRVVANGGVVADSSVSVANTVLVTGASSQWRGNTSIIFGNGGSDNVGTVSAGGVIVTPTFSIGSAATATNNRVFVTGSGSLITNSTQTVVGDLGKGNRLVIADGGRVVSAAGHLGFSSGSDNNAVEITGQGAEWNVTGDLRVGRVGAGNELIITNGGLATVNGSLYIGVNSGTATNNSVRVTGPDSMLRVLGFVSAGSNAVYTSGRNSHLILTDGGVLEVNSLVGGASSTAGSISNIGGVFQFTSATPFVTLYGPQTVVVSNGTVAYRGVSTANIYYSQVSNITFYGQNTFRLNASTNAISGQSYHFTTTLGPTNYARLEMVNGHTAYRGGNITIGTGGSMLLSNTVANITGLFTNTGVFTSINSVGTFHSRVHNAGAWITDPTTNVFLSDYTVANTGSISMDAGDVFIFKSNFVNQSTQNTTYNTSAGKFLFDGVGGYTQHFFTAALDLGPGGIYPGLPGATNILGGQIPANNFALGTLEIANGSTLMISDSFTGDGLRAALYLDTLLINPTALLIISNNVSVYFINSNGWNFASNIILMGDAELHQLIPEPSTLLLGVVGAFLFWRASQRRRSSTRS